MGIINRLIVMSFLQFFIWGAWLITVSNYWFITKKWGGAEFGAIFSTLGFASLIMPPLTGIIADRWVNAERLYGILHLLGGIALACIPMVNDPGTFFWVIFAAMLCYMPTLSLSNSVAYHILVSNRMDVIKVFPPIRVWGTIGFIAAMWLTNLTENKASANQLHIVAAVVVKYSTIILSISQVSETLFILAIPFFLMMTNGFGAIFGSLVSGFVIDRFLTTGGIKDWHGIWLSFAIYALVIAVAFAALFKHRHDPEVILKPSH